MDLVLRAVKAITDARWVLLYVERWLAAPLKHPDGVLEQRSRELRTYLRRWAGRKY